MCKSHKLSPLLKDIGSLLKAHGDGGHKHDSRIADKFAELSQTVDELARKEARRLLLPGHEPLLGLEKDTLEDAISGASRSELIEDQRVFDVITSPYPTRQPYAPVVVARVLSRCGIDESGNARDEIGVGKRGKCLGKKPAETAQLT